MSYRENEVRALVKMYTELRARIDTTPSRLHHLVRIADLDRAMSMLSVVYWEVVLLHGLIGLTLEQTAKALDTNITAVFRRYEAAVDSLTDYMNGGDY